MAIYSTTPSELPKGAFWSGKLKTTAGAHRVSYDDVLRHIDIA